MGAVSVEGRGPQGDVHVDNTRDSDMKFLSSCLLSVPLMYQI